MMTLIINNEPHGSTVIVPPPAGDEPVIKNTFFFPDVDPVRVRELMRLEQTVPPARLRSAIKTGIAETNAELYEWRALQIAAGFTQLADVPAEKIDGESERVFHYLSALSRCGCERKRRQESRQHRHHHRRSVARHALVGGAAPG